MMKNLSMKFMFAIALLSFFSVTASANKTSVEVEAPEKAKKGSEVTVVINVSHMGNTKAHFTDWVSVKINGKEIKRWEYTKSKLPEAAKFTLKYKFVLNEKSTIEVKGNCNKHGSTGSKTVVIDLE
jgi:desulfoferrodoxin (superoxide reductase-like protein)